MTGAPRPDALPRRSAPPLADAPLLPAPARTGWLLVATLAAGHAVLNLAGCERRTSPPPSPPSAGALDAGPGSLPGAADSSADLAARRRDLEAEWSRLAAALPDKMTSVESRLAALEHAGHPAHGVDVAAARSRMRDVYASWSKARAAFAARNLAQAVETATAVGTKLDGLASQLDAAAPWPDPSASRPDGHAASSPSLTMTAPPPMRTAASASRSNSKHTLT